MALKDFFARLFGKTDKQYTYARMLEGQLPIFSQFGHDIYASDAVQMAVDCIASEVSKLQPRHIRTDNDRLQSMPATSLNRLFRVSPNPLMTTRDFLEKIIWLLYMNYNCFIYPAYDLVTDARGVTTKEYTALFPLNPMQVEFLQDAAGQLFAQMRFQGGDKFTLPYSEVIHLRKKFSVNSVLGGGLNGQPDNQSLLKVLQINDTVLQGLDKAIKTSLTLRGILKINTMIDTPEQKTEREKFEAALADSKSGILPLDLKGEYIDLKPDPKIIDQATLAFLQDKILNWYGVPLKILSGTFNDEEYQAFYEKTLEPLVISLGQAFSKTLFSERELAFGNEIVFYHRDMMYLSTKSKLELLKIAGEQGLLTDNQKLALLGYPPLAGGDRRTISLNYISVEIADQYQLKRAGSAGESPATRSAGRGWHLPIADFRAMKPRDWQKEYEKGTPHWAEDLTPSLFAQEFVERLRDGGIQGKVLEIGCGNGRDSIFFARAGFEVTAVDVAPGAIKLAQDNAKDAGVKINLQTANAENLPFEDGSFDAVFTLSVLHATNLSRSIPETARVLTAGGLLFVYIYGNTESVSGTVETRATVDGFIALLKDNGYEIVDLYAEREKEYDEAGERHQILVALCRKGE